MSETQIDEDPQSDSGPAGGKRKTTYPRNHPTNPKGPKRSRAEIQQAAKEKKEAQQARKEAAELEKQRKLIKAEEKRKLSTKRIAVAEDAVQRAEKNRQLHSERPDLCTMETYSEEVQKKKEHEYAAPAMALDELIEELDDDEMYLDQPGHPPESTIDTDSDGVHLGMSGDSDDDDAYNPPSEDDEDADADGGGDASDDSMMKLYVQLQEKVKTKNLKGKKKKEIGKLQAEIQGLRKVPPTVHAHPDVQMLNKGNGEEGKKAKSGKSATTGGLHADWKKRTQAQVQLPSVAPTATSTAATVPQASVKPRPSATSPASTAATVPQATVKPRPSTTSSATAAASSATAALPISRSGPGRQNQASDQQSNTDDADATRQADVGGLGANEDDEALEAVRKDKQASGGSKKTHKGGTEAMGIKLKTADITAVKQSSARTSAKPRYSNTHLPFENSARDLLTWRNAVLPAIIDWVGTLEEPFAANSHPDLPGVIEKNWDEEFPEIPADDAVQAVANSAIRNWRSAIGKHALERLDKIFKAEPYKNSKNQRKEYVERELKDLMYIYRDRETKSGAYRSPAIIEVFAVHQHVITKTEKFYDYPVGAMSLCAAAHERALKLWSNGTGPTKETKKSFIRKPWASRVAAHYKVVSKLSKRAWNEIHESSTAAIGAVDADATADNSEIEDPEDVVQLSESDNEGT